MKKFSFVAVLLFFVNLSGFGQAVGCFTTENSAGQIDSVFCTGQTVFAIDCFPNADPATTEWDFGTGLGWGLASSFVYTAPGVYTIKQRGTPTIGPSYQLFKENYLTVVALPNPQFSVTACNNNQVLINLPDTTYDTYTVVQGDGTTSTHIPPHSFIHTYANSGTYTITVSGTDYESGCNGTSTFTVTTLAQLPTAEIEKVEVLNAPFPTGSTQLSFTSVAGYKYGVYFRPVSSGTFQLVGSFTALNTGISASTHSPVNNVQQGCYRIETQDACNSASLPISEEVCTTTLLTTPLNGQNQISWQAYPMAVAPTLQEYQLYRNGNLVATLLPGTTNYTDAAIACGRNYCYQVQALTQTGPLSVSNQSCAVAISISEPPVAALHASFSLQNTIGLTLYPPQNASISQSLLFRSINGSGFAPLGAVNGNLFTDSDTSSAYTSYCYQAAYLDSCGNQSETGNTACPVLLTGNLQNTGGTAQQVQLTWSAYAGYQSGVARYEVEVLDELFNPLQTIPVGNVLSFTQTNLPGNSAVLRYRIKAYPVSPAEPQVYSNNIRFRQELSFAIPTAFSPNGDNLNDEFEVKGGGNFREFDLSITSRTGQVVFQSSATRRAWDGTANGKPLPPDVYVVQFRGIDSFGRTIFQTGTLTLLR